MVIDGIVGGKECSQRIREGLKDGCQNILGSTEGYSHSLINNNNIFLQQNKSREIVRQRTQQAKTYCAKAQSRDGMRRRRCCSAKREAKDQQQVR